MDKKIVFIGAGSMAEAIIAGILKSKFVSADSINVINKSNQDRVARLEQRYHVQYPENKRAVIEAADIVVLSTKPYDIETAVESVRSYLHEDQLIVSVIAGISTDYIGELIDKQIPIVRAMPNTSAAIGQSATAISAGKFATAAQLQLTKALFDTIGLTVTVEEANMHTVTSISGSGPAYIYYLVEAMEKAAIDAGLEPLIAKQLISQTVLGAGEMLKASTEPAAELRKKITSKRGTTEAGIEVLNKCQFQEAVIACVESARKRSIALGKQE
ncbi:MULTISPECIES: pyrroline-5-carboxylate reductase [unclassified Virgibacillus]|uniref:pyrroline-5-carboxylate reductase n=1 Tax=unclassified Virgibacillus TaxID=2620237 RepID=UPI0024DE9693|nr:pyrroline-5-carboxylate reductase [Virgibacillus sp. LDC-1]